MSTSLVTHPKLRPAYNQTEERQVLEVDIDNNLLFATIFISGDRKRSIMQCNSNNDNINNYK